MKTVLYAVGALVISVTAAFAAPHSERASVKPAERGDRELSRDHGDRMPVALEREIEFDAQPPAMRAMTPGQARGWTGNDNEG